MADLSARRLILLLVPSPDGGHLLAVGSRLPTIELTVPPGESTIEAAGRALPSVGLRAPVLDCVVDQAEQADLGDEARSALVELVPPPADWNSPAEWEWLPWDRLDPVFPSGLTDVAQTRIAELRGESSVPPERAAWTRPGWSERAIAWIEQSLESAGRCPPDNVVQFRHWGISAVMRVDAADGRTWFKAPYPPFRHEAAVSALLAEIAPDATCGVIATDATDGWLLLDDLGDRTSQTDEETTRAAVDRLVRLQADLRTHRAELLAHGCAHRPLSGLAGDLEIALQTDVAAKRLGLSHERIRELVGAVHEADASIESVGFPETLVHGDFHPGNVAATDRGVVVFDWSDSAIGHPAIEAATWASWFEGDEPREAALWAMFIAAWEREFGIDTALLRRSDVDVVAGAFHTVSYIRILSALERSAQVEHAEGLDHFFGVLTRGAEQRSSS